MSTAALVINLGYAAVAAALAIAWFRISRARKTRRLYLQAHWDESTQRWANDTEHDVGPDSLRLLQDTERYVDQLVANDPELAAGFGRLRQAIRDQQQKGEQS